MSQVSGPSHTPTTTRTDESIGSPVRHRCTGRSDRICAEPMQVRRARMPGRRLSPEEERDLVVATERGDEGASWQLVDAFLPLIGGVARRFNFGGGVERAELMQ